MAARIYLVFRVVSSRVSPRQSHRVRRAHGVGLGALFRVLQSETIGGFSWYSSSETLCAVKRLARILPERTAHPLYGQAGSCTSQASLW